MRKAEMVGRDSRKALPALTESPTVSKPLILSPWHHQTKQTGQPSLRKQQEQSLEALSPSCSEDGC
jgi:hypothetical protein